MNNYILLSQMQGRCSPFSKDAIVTCLMEICYCLLHLTFFNIWDKMSSPTFWMGKAYDVSWMGIWQTTHQYKTEVSSGKRIFIPLDCFFFCLFKWGVGQDKTVDSARNALLVSVQIAPLFMWTCTHLLPILSTKVFSKPFFSYNFCMMKFIFNHLG